MEAMAIVGANWGDEGKGKMTDVLAATSDVVVRFQGGGNAGHTVINAFGKFALHLLPSGVFHPHVTNVLGPGVAVDLTGLLAERDDLLARGVPEFRLRVSDRAQVVLPWHRLLDQYEEDRLGDQGFGSTRSGIAPFYADKCLKVGVQVADLFDRSRLRQRLSACLARKVVLFEHLYARPAPDADAVYEQLASLAERVRPFVADTTGLLHEA